MDKRFESLEERIDRSFFEFRIGIYRAMVIQTGVLAAIVFGMLQFIGG